MGKRVFLEKMLQKVRPSGRPSGGKEDFSLISSETLSFFDHLDGFVE